MRNFGPVCALLLLSACGGAVGETVAVATSGGEQDLRSRMRPIRGEDRVLIIALDGVGDGAFRAALQGGRLPSLGGLLGHDVGEAGGDRFEHGYLAPDVLTTLPSTTLAAWATIVTGEPPSRTGVPGNEWFDRSVPAFRAPAPVSVSGQAHTMRSLSEGWLNERVRVPTLFEQADVRAHVSLLPIHRGADLLTYPNGMDIFQVLSILPEGIFGGQGISAETYIEMDEESTGPLLDAHGAHGGIPDLQLAYFPGVDLVTHISDPPLDAQQRHLQEVVDPAIARILEAYREAGELEDTWIVVIADHGHTPVPSDDAHALAVDAETDPPALLTALGFRVRPPELETDREDFSAVVAYQGNFAYVYLADRSTCPNEGDRCDWSVPPRYEEDVLPVARAYRAASAEGAHVPALRDTLEMVLTRRPVPVDDDATPFEVLGDGDALVPLARWLRDHPQPEWVDAPTRLRELSAGPSGHLAGDVLLVSRLSPTIPLEDRTYFSGPYHSWHGSPTRTDSVVPFAVIHVDEDGPEIARRVERILRPGRSTARFSALILDLLEIDDDEDRR